MTQQANISRLQVAGCRFQVRLGQVRLGYNHLVKRCNPSFRRESNGVIPSSKNDQRRHSTFQLAKQKPWLLLICNNFFIFLYFLYFFYIFKISPINIQVIFCTYFCSLLLNIQSWSVWISFQIISFSITQHLNANQPHR